MSEFGEGKMSDQIGDPAQSALRELSKRTYKTYKSRLVSEERLRKTGNWWNAAQFASATALIAVSIRFLVSAHSDQGAIGAIMVTLSVLSLVVSIVVNSLNYSARADAMFRNYRAIQKLSVRLETLILAGAQPTADALEELQEKYDQLLDFSENHTTTDHLESLRQAVKKEATKASDSSSSTGVGHWLAKRRPFVLPVIITAGSIIAIACSMFVMW